MLRLDEVFRDREQLHYRALGKSITDKQGDFDNENLTAQYEEYGDLKQSLVEVQKSLSNLEIVEWHQVTTKFHPAAAVLRHIRSVTTAPLVTQAWLKFYEILTYFPQLVEHQSQHQSFTSLHLCEAPGAFISALMQFCDGMELPLPNWMAATMNPWHEEAAAGEVINIDSLILAFPDKWIFGADNTGNIFSGDALSSLHGVKFSFITSDGGIDCSADPEFQEQNSSTLKQAEFLTICDKVAVGGHAVLKLFSCCHSSTLMILESAANSFESAFLTKPASSKAGNSELYLVMLNYSGSIAPLENTSYFLQQTLPIVTFFTNRQRDAIQNNLKFKYILTADTLKQVEVESEIEISTQNMMNQFQNITLDHPWKGLELWSSFPVVRRRKGTLNDRRTQSERNVSEAITACSTTSQQLPRKKRFNSLSVYIERLYFICVDRRLTHITNSPFITPIWLDRYNSLISDRATWFTEVDNFDEIDVSYPDCFIRAVSASTTFVIGRDRIDSLQYPIVLLPVTGSPFLPWSEIILRSSFISDLQIALQKIDENGGLIIKCQYWTMCSRLLAQFLSILIMTFGSLEVHYIGNGTSLFWFRQIIGVERQNTLKILDTISSRLTHCEVLEIFPFHQLAENHWLISLLRNFNDFMVESIIRTLVHYKNVEEIE